MQQPTWKVHGYDTFAREDYFLGEFPTEAAAQEFAEQQRAKLAAWQSPELRDRIWIEPPPTSGQQQSG